MKFGKLENIQDIDFSLPNDHGDTAASLGGNSAKADVYAGGTMWNIPGWKGKLYPNKTKNADLIRLYGQQFGTIELNATHYKIHPPEVMRRWADEMPDDFKFCPKFPQLISHYRRFNNCEQLTDEFLVGIQALGSKAGPSFIQLPPHFAPKHAEALSTYLDRWPVDVAMAIEFRHPDWFSASAEAEMIWRKMKVKGIGAVISDTSGRRDAVHMRMTSKFLILRFGGNNLHPTDDLRLVQWARRIAEWQTLGLNEVHFLVHQPDSINTPETCIRFSEVMKKEGIRNIKSPQLLQSTLF